MPARTAADASAGTTSGGGVSGGGRTPRPVAPVPSGGSAHGACHGVGVAVPYEATCFYEGASPSGLYGGGGFAVDPLAPSYAPVGSGGAFGGESPYPTRSASVGPGGYGHDRRHDGGNSLRTSLSYPLAGPLFGGGDGGGAGCGPIGPPPHRRAASMSAAVGGGGTGGFPLSGPADDGDGGEGGAAAGALWDETSSPLVPTDLFHAALSLGGTPPRGSFRAGPPAVRGAARAPGGGATPPPTPAASVAGGAEGGAAAPPTPPRPASMNCTRRRCAAPTRRTSTAATAPSASLPTARRSSAPSNGTQSTRPSCAATLPSLAPARMASGAGSSTTRGGGGIAGRAPPQLGRVLGGGGGELGAPYSPTPRAPASAPVPSGGGGGASARRGGGGLLGGGGGGGGGGISAGFTPLSPTDLSMVSSRSFTPPTSAPAGASSLAVGAPCVHGVPAAALLGGGGTPLSLHSSPAGALVGGPGAARGASPGAAAAPPQQQQQQRPYLPVIRYGGPGAGAADGGAAVPPPSTPLLAAAWDFGGRGGGRGHAASTSWDGAEAPQSLSAGHFTLGTAAGGVGAMRTSSRLRVFEDIKARAEQQAQH
ncbi:hypothetical protein BU14_0491s0006 [Porphyra umbilicalis]|uniref:Uncharacterized protein n=1 Tax=Porphyra umbilicalis TaxID=2786 RepID=A0A1X6NTD8_PORUM|nr:hypothetical protein BU14_0491s0006 [Porphyra umbilicalis]|eukprot:OSX71899.1 hypothetical protein BU14_0491s0006 [Porphyra umbilicalis]